MVEVRGFYQTCTERYVSMHYIYLIKLKDKPKYVGYTSRSIVKRWKQHCHNTKILNTPLSNAIKKYGQNEFVIEELFSSNDKNFTLRVMEPIFIWEYQTFIDWDNGGYNLTLGGDAPPITSETTKKKQSLAKKGKIRGPRPKEIIEKIRLANLNRKVSEETKLKISKSFKGKKLTETHKQNISKNLKGRKGKPLSEETKKKLSLVFKGKKIGPRSEETKKKLSEAAKKRIYSEEELNKIIARNKQRTGTKLSEKTKIKMREAQKLRRLRESQGTICEQ